MKDINEIEINSEKIYLKKSKIFGWTVVYPTKNPDGSINWFNLITGGSWLRLVALIVIIIIILGFFYEYSTQARLLASLLEKNITFSQAQYLNISLL